MRVRVTIYSNMSYIILFCLISIISSRSSSLILILFLGSETAGNLIAVGTMSPQVRMEMHNDTYLLIKITYLFYEYGGVLALLTYFTTERLKCGTWMSSIRSSLRLPLARRSARRTRSGIALYDVLFKSFNIY